MSLLDRILGRKDSEVGPLISFRQLGRPVWMRRNFEAYAKEGYSQNVIAHRCIRLRAEACSAIPLIHYERGEEISESPLLEVLARPNPWQSGPELIDAFISFYSLTGNGYFEGVTLDEALEEIYTLRPDRMRVIPGRRGYPAAYEYTVSAEKKYRFDQEVSRGQIQPILHMKEFNPTDDWYGLSPMEAAAFSIDAHNEAGNFNKSLLQNSASPSGALVYEGAPDGDGDTLSEEAFTRLKKEMAEQYQGARNAGKPMLLEGGLKWQPMGMTPKDLEFILGKREAAREICLAFGVPPMLLGIPGDNTFSNYREANRAFYRSTIIPLMSRTCGALSNWVQPIFPDAKLGFDLDEIEALAEERASKWEQVEKSQFLTTDEKRTAVGYGAYEPNEEPGGRIMVGAAQMPLEEAGFVAGGAEPEEDPEEDPIEE